jgi:hypothetical protein
MIVTLPSSSQKITDTNFFTDTIWFTFFERVWRAIRGDIGISLSGKLCVSTETTSNSSSTDTDLITCTLSANTLVNTNDILEIYVWGTFAANNNSKTLTLYFGSQILYTTGSAILNSGSWFIKTRIIRKTSSTQEILVEITSSNASISTSTIIIAGTQDLTNDLIIKCVGKGVISEDVTQNALQVNLTPNT